MVYRGSEAHLVLGRGSKAQRIVGRYVWVEVGGREEGSGGREEVRVGLSRGGGGVRSDESLQSGL